MGLLIDSSILIEYERGRLDLEARIRERERELFFLSVITASELLHGAWRAREAALRATRLAFVEKLLGRFDPLDVTLDIARAHAQLWAEQKAAGRIIGPHDLWLAATCVTHGLGIVTANVREFERVPGLKVEVW